MIVVKRMILSLRTKRLLVNFVLLTTLMTTTTGHKPSGHPESCVKCPYFTNTSSFVRTSVGIPVNLTCGVRNLGFSQVSWIRKRDLHVLTTESMTYTSDSRFRALHVQGSPFWNLEISYPVPEDAGVYECQISSQPKQFRRFTLDVSVPVASIVGSNEVYMKSGSDINITCIVTGHTEPVNVMWYHDIPDEHGGGTEEIHSAERGGVQLVTDRKGGSSWLLVTKAKWRDAGNYSCSPSFTSPAYVTVHVIQAEEAPAAMTPELTNSVSSIHPNFKIWHFPDENLNDFQASRIGLKANEEENEEEAPLISPIVGRISCDILQFSRQLIYFLSSWWWIIILLSVVYENCNSDIIYSMFLKRRRVKCLRISSSS